MKLDGNVLLLGVILAIVFYYVVLPRMPNMMEGMAPVEQPDVVKVDLNKCSRDCCKHAQWPVPHMTLGYEKEDPYVSTNLMCNHGEGGGCVCMTKDQFSYLSRRGNNLV